MSIIAGIDKKAKGCFLMLCFIFLGFLFSKCEDEVAKPREYPRINTRPVSGISEGGATFNGEIYSLGSESVIEHGFVWGTGNKPELDKNRIYLGPSESTGLFSANVTTTLLKDTEYTVRTFVQTAVHLVYGSPVKFKSLGSGAPVILGFEPDSATWLDTISVRGRNFSWAASENIVKLNALRCPVVRSTDTTLNFIVGNDILDPRSGLSVELAGNKSVYTADSLTLLYPVIDAFYPEQASWGDTITFTGRNFPVGNSTDIISARIGGKPAIVIKRINDTLLVTVPYNLSTISSAFDIKINSIPASVAGEMTLLPPVIESFNPKEGTWKTSITLKGKFNLDKERNQIQIGGFDAGIYSICRDSIIVFSPVDMIDRNNLIVNISAPFTVTAKDTFRLLGPAIESVTPLSGYSNSEVSIHGNYLKDYYGHSTVTFGSQTAEVISNSGSVIVCRVPEFLNNGPAEIKVKVASQTAVYKDPFIVNNPVITGFYPLNGTFEDTITIEGVTLGLSLKNAAGKGYPEVYFRNGSTDRQAIKISASENKIVVKVPVDIDSIPATIKIDFGQFSVYSSDHFTLDPPVIDSVSISASATGNDLIIKGSNFNPDPAYNMVQWGSYFLTIKSSTPNEIVAIVPEDFSGNSNRIMVKTGGYIRYSPEVIILRKPVITSFLPLNGSFESDITIFGENLKIFEGESEEDFYPEVYFSNGSADRFATIVSITNSEINVLVPADIDSIPCKIKLKYPSSGTILYSSDEFVLNPPLITYVSPEMVSPGEDLTILGGGFNPDPGYNSVFAGVHPLVVKETVLDGIIATVPAGVPEGYYTITVKTGGYTRHFESYMDSNRRPVNSPEIQTTYHDNYYYGISNYSSASSTNGYVVSSAMGATFKFLPGLNSWERLNIEFPFSDLVVKMGQTGFEDGDSAGFLLISGHYNGSQIKTFHTETNKWASIDLSDESLVNTAGVAFNIGGRIYFGLDFYSSSGSFWECNRWDNFKWTRLNDFPVTSPVPFSSYFAINNRGYIVFSNNEVWQFNPSSKQWTRKNDFPGPARVLAASCVSENYAFFGTGKSTDGQEYDDIWRYEPGTDKWIHFCSIPGKRHSAVMFNVYSRSRLFIGFGLHEVSGIQTNLFDFYELPDGLAPKGIH